METISKNKIEDLLQELEGLIAPYGSALVAFSGGVDSSLALALKEQRVPPMRNLKKVSDECADLDYVVDEPRDAPGLEAAMCANLGVGGHNVAVVLERAE